MVAGLRCGGRAAAGARPRSSSTATPATRARAGRSSGASSGSVWASASRSSSAWCAGHDAALAYLTAYLIEESLSVDNLFVFLALFTYFGVAAEHQHRVLFWGIVGAIVFRGIFIFAGVALITRFHWVIYVLGILLVATGAKLGLGEAEQVHPERNLIVRWASRVLPMEKSFHGEHFTVRTEKGLRFTPLFLVLLAIESTDVMFAVDSVPAVLAVSRDAFVVYTSNIFAVLGLRALYFVLAGALRSLRLLRPALAIILVLVGVKMLLADVVEIPTAASLVVVAVDPRRGDRVAPCCFRSRRRGRRRARARPPALPTPPAAWKGAMLLQALLREEVVVMAKRSSGKTRLEKDTLGSMEVPADALYGAQTARAVANFPISGWTLPAGFLSALARIKAAFARANGERGLLSREMAKAIAAAADEVAAGSHLEHFPLDVFQTGSGTSTNMNMNEVLAHLANRTLGGDPTAHRPVHPNDHVNLGALAWRAG